MISIFINIFIFLIIIDAIGSFVPELRRYELYQKLHEFLDILLRPIRNLMPQNLPVDLSPMLLIIFLRFLSEIF